MGAEKRCITCKKLLINEHGFLCSRCQKMGLYYVKQGGKWVLRIGGGALVVADVISNHKEKKL